MRHGIALLSLIALLCTPPLWSAEAEPVFTLKHASGYHTAWLQLEKGGLSFTAKSQPPVDVSLFLGLRDEQAVVAWFAHPSLAGGRIV